MGAQVLQQSITRLFRHVREYETVQASRSNGANDRKKTHRIYDERSVVNGKRSSGYQGMSPSAIQHDDADYSEFAAPPARGATSRIKVST